MGWEPGGARHCLLLILVMQPFRLDQNTCLPRFIERGLRGLAARLDWIGVARVAWWLGWAEGLAARFNCSG